MPDAMPFLNRYLGNPVLTTIGKVLFGITMSDFRCGMRAFRRDKVLGINLVTTGMEWASEMVIKSRLAGLAMTEVPVTLHRDGRSRRPHLKRWRDGWRIAAAVPAVIMGFVVLRILVKTAADPTSHNLWPFEILMTGAVSVVIMAAIVVARKVSGASSAS